MNKFYFLLILFLGMTVSGSAQALYPVDFKEKGDKATLIVEARAQKGTSFWNPAHTMIYTAWDLEVYKVFKGELPTSVQIVTTGGSVGDQAIVASDLLELQGGNTGVFFLYPNASSLKAPGAPAPLYDVYASAQGFLKYDLATSTASAPFARYRSLENELYPALMELTGKRFSELKPIAQILPSAGAKRGTAATISSWSPLRVHGGAFNDPANNTLTITGTGFGTPSGSAAVGFDDNNDGGGGTPYLIAWNDANHMVSWTNTQIVVKVPGRAGTGTLSIYDNTGAVAGTSASNLIVDFGIIEAEIGGAALEPNMMNTNGSGGYSIYYSTRTTNSGVDITGTPTIGTFQRALTTHRQTGGVNFTDVTGAVTNTTDSQTIDPYTFPNLVEYDNAGTGTTPLPSGVLGVCISGYSRCSGRPARLVGFDVLLRNTAFSQGTASFTEGPCAPIETSTSNIDLEGVILHELGHAVTQAHVIDAIQNTGGGFAAVNPSAVMHYAITNGLRRISYDNPMLTGIQYAIAPQGLAYGACPGSFSEMVPLTAIISARDECSGLFPATVPYSGTSIAFDLVHATSNKNTDPQHTAFKTTGIGTNVTNTQYYAFRTTAAGGTISVTISGYATTPAALASCNTDGVEMALYQVSTCPTGQAYPTPVEYRTFSGNGALTPFSGLAASTNYLLIADGLENTKATFNAVITSPTALPLTLVDFRGRAQGMHHLLEWQFSPSELPQSCILERSRDGKVYATLYENQRMVSAEDAFTDEAPFTGNNYYRLRFADKSGTVTYSKVIMLAQQNSGRFALAPTPAQTITNLYYTANSPEAVNALLYSASGQLVARWQWMAQTGENTFPIDVALLASGCYTLQVNTGDQAKHLKLMKQ